MLGIFRWTVLQYKTGTITLLHYKLGHEWMAIKYEHTEGTVDTLSYGSTIPVTPDPLKSLMS